MCKKELETGQLNSRNERDDEQYFIGQETPVRGRQVRDHDAAIQAYRDRYAGFFALLSTRKMDALEALEIYRNKDTIEQIFDDLKNALDLKRRRMHSSGRMAGRLFVQLIALILFSQILQVLREKDLASRYSPKLVLGEMESLTKIHDTGQYNDLVSEVSQTQREILAAFGIDPNTL